MRSGTNKNLRESIKKLRHRLILRLAFRIVAAGSLLSLQPMAHAQKSVPNADSVVAKPVINMLSSPADNSDVTSQALYGTGVLAIEKRGEWTKIRTADEYTGWVRTTDLHAIEPC